MAEWRKAAEGPLTALRSMIGELDLQKGDRIQVRLDLRLPAAWAFDAPGAERLFQPFVPTGAEVIDVRGEGATTGVVEMEADPVPLAAVLAFISQHWLQIVIAGLALSFLVVWVTVLVKITTGVVTTGGKLAPLLILGIVFVVLYAVGKRR